MNKFYSYELPADDVNYVYLDSYNLQYISRPHFHKSQEFLCCLEGELFAYTNGESFTLKAGDIFYADSYEVHDYYSIDNVGCMALVFSSDFLNDFNSAHGGRRFPSFIEGTDGTKRAVSYLHDWQKNYYSSEKSDYAMSAGYINVFLSILAKECKLIKRKSRGQDDTIIKLLSYIEENYREDITLGDLARLTNYNANYLSKLFNRHLGRNIREYINTVRISKIERLLLDAGGRDIKVTDIALSNGFTNLKTFYRAYKKIMGRAPLSQKS